MLLAGGLSWAALYTGGVHPALAMVPILPFMPHEKRDLDGTPLGIVSEAAVTATTWRLLPGSGDRIVPIGRPIANVRVHILDRAAEPLPAATTAALSSGLSSGISESRSSGLRATAARIVR